MILLPHERFYLWRRRQGYTQVQAAQHLRIAKRRLERWESGEIPVPEAFIPRPMIPAKTHEYCIIKRRRSGMTTTEVAEAMGISRVTLLKRENGKGKVSELAKFWGFTISVE